MIRESFFRGSFYPDTKEDIEEMILNWNRGFKSKKVQAKALIVPHAGYIYSGAIANLAYRAIESRERIFLFGPSHRFYFRGVSLGDFDSFSTPFGELRSDKSYLKNLKLKFQIESLNDAHIEHSTETQIPLLKYYFPDSLLFEFIYSDIDSHSLDRVFKFLLEDEKNLIVISTDLSHFHSLNRAKELDTHCLRAIEELKEPSSECEACGKVGLSAILRVAKELNLNSKVLNYDTSATQTLDESKVVGYTSAILT